MEAKLSGIDGVNRHGASGKSERALLPIHTHTEEHVCTVIKVLSENQLLAHVLQFSPCGSSCWVRMKTSTCGNKCLQSVVRLSNGAQLHSPHVFITPIIPRRPDWRHDHIEGFFAQQTQNLRIRLRLRVLKHGARWCQKRHEDPFPTRNDMENLNCWWRGLRTMGSKMTSRQIIRCFVHDAEETHSRTNCATVCVTEREVYTDQIKHEGCHLIRIEEFLNNRTSLGASIFDEWDKPSQRSLSAKVEARAVSSSFSEPSTGSLPCVPRARSGSLADSCPSACETHRIPSF